MEYYLEFYDFLVEEQEENECQDGHKFCKDWASRGECTTNSQWMSVNCKKSCKTCGKNKI